MKELKGLNVHVVVVSQVSRNCIEREDKRPVISDLHSSIEQNCDIIAFLHRESCYDPECDPNLGECIIARNHHGETGTINFSWDELCAKTKTLGKISIEDISGATKQITSLPSNVLTSYNLFGLALKLKCSMAEIIDRYCELYEDSETKLLLIRVLPHNNFNDSQAS
jgi:hypothetical protein